MVDSVFLPAFPGGGKAYLLVLLFSRSQSLLPRFPLSKRVAIFYGLSPSSEEEPFFLDPEEEEDSSAWPRPDTIFVLNKVFPPPCLPPLE